VPFFRPNAQRSDAARGKREPDIVKRVPPAEDPRDGDTENNSRSAKYVKMTFDEDMTPSSTALTETRRPTFTAAAGHMTFSGNGGDAHDNVAFEVKTPSVNALLFSPKSKWHRGVPPAEKPEPVSVKIVPPICGPDTGANENTLEGVR